MGKQSGGSAEAEVAESRRWVVGQVAEAHHRKRFQSVA